MSEKSYNGKLQRIITQTIIVTNYGADSQAVSHTLDNITDNRSQSITLHTLEENKPRMKTPNPSVTAAAGQLTWKRRNQSTSATLLPRQQP